MSKNEEKEERFKDILNLVQSHLVDGSEYLIFIDELGQRFSHPKTFTTFEYPVLTGLPPSTPINPNPNQTLFFILKNDEKVSVELFAKFFDWAKENVRHYDEEIGGWVNNDWECLVVAIVHPDSTIAYYKVHDGIHKPLEGLAGV